jgi:hypothetical protein
MFLSSGKGKETPTLLGSLERAGLNQPLPPPEDQTDPISEMCFLVI